MRNSDVWSIVMDFGGKASGVVRCAGWRAEPLRKERRMHGVLSRKRKKQMGMVRQKNWFIQLKGRTVNHFLLPSKQGDTPKKKVDGGGIFFLNAMWFNHIVD